METFGLGASTYRQPNKAADRALRDVADQLEATFISEMLKSAGVAETPSLFGGGAGEGRDQGQQQRAVLAGTHR